jgi:oligoribonuclease
MKNTDSIIWLDLEMTGLDPSKDKIIEIATLATDGLLNIIDIGPVIAINYFKDIIFEMDDWNKDQHAKSGLLDRIKNSKISLYQAEIKTLNFIKKYTYEKKSYNSWQ